MITNIIPYSPYFFVDGTSNGPHNDIDNYLGPCSTKSEQYDRISDLKFRVFYLGVPGYPI